MRCVFASIQASVNASRNISFEELTSSIRSANSIAPVGTIDGNKQMLTIVANKQLQNAAEFANIIVSNKGGQPVSCATRCGER